MLKTFWNLTHNACFVGISLTINLCSQYNLQLVYIHIQYIYISIFAEL